MQLCIGTACDTPSVQVHDPCGIEFDTLRTSLRGPFERFKSIRLSEEPATLSVTVPVSVSEPAIRVAVPVRVTSVIAVLPESAASDAVASETACGSFAAGVDVEVDCRAKVGSTAKGRQNNRTSRFRVISLHGGASIAEVYSRVRKYCQANIRSGERQRTASPWPWRARQSAADFVVIHKI
jgi:hypothetical protein